MKKFLIILATCFSLFISHLNAGTIDPLTDDAKYIEYGKKFKYVYQLCGVYQDKSLFCASGVAIDDRWVLTAAHVIKNAKLCGLNNESNKETILVEDFFVHENFNDEFGIADIGLLYLSKDLNLDFYPPLYDNKDEVGKLCCISGYGLTGTFLTGQIKGDNIKRAGSNIIDSIDRHLLICSPSPMKQRTELEFLIASGDSGGGLFIDGKLAGINSCVMQHRTQPRSAYGSDAGHTRISLYVDWIKNIIKHKKEKR
jgi:hypothetical protein